LGIPYNLLAYCEIDKYASKAYSIIHDVPEEKNLRDVTKVDILDIEDRVDLITYGFPCQDISNAGEQKGLKLVCEKCNAIHEISENEVRHIMIGQPIFCENCGEELDLTRSGLFFHALRIINDYSPKFAIAENVKALTSKKFTEEFKIVLESLEEAGYNNYWRVLNAKDYGVPQNRERVFIISIRKDIDKGFKFPDPIPLELRLKDILEDEVDEKYYLSDHTLEVFRKHRERHENRGNGFGYTGPRDLDGVATAITTKQGQRQSDNFIEVREATKKGYAEAYPGDTINLNYPNSKTRRGGVGKNGVANALTCTDIQAVVVPSETDEIEDFLNE